ncbi:hypothetical protein J2809_002646 [Arthrobacter pascens]|uniref:hypothetical protein n=1 Tax=Arthrobacter pascens TaxID=1677 RepID=UPI00285A328D|nr:hypothetical protein [Arthrobacter pascens]MDR6558276.1 hypothetical protein [Arthrobacter pascens]
MTDTLSTTITLPSAETVDRALAAVSAQGFGILSEINVGSTFEAINPQTMVQLSASPAAKEVADDAGARLRRALAALGN